MRGVIVALLCACSSGENPEDQRPRQAQPRFAIDAAVPTYSDEPPWDAPSGDVAVVETGAVTITPPKAKGTVRDGAVLVARVPNGFRLVTAGAIAGESITVPPGDPIEPVELARRAGPAGVLLLVDGKDAFIELSDFAFALHRECWAIATVDGGVLGGVWGNPCPSSTPDGDTVPQVAVVIGPTGAHVGVTSPRTSFPVTFDALTAKLRTIHQTAFAKRTDLVYTVANGVSVDVVVQTTLAMHAAGFTGARWVPPPWIPMRLSPEVGNDPPQPRVPMPPPPQVTVTVGDAALLGKASLTRDEIGRVFKSRVGIYRACYQKELNRTPNIKGTIETTFEIDRGLVTKVTSRGSLKNEPVETCIRANVMRLRFPLKPALTRAKVTLTFSAS